jgi:hypothetical protein
MYSFERDAEAGGIHAALENPPLAEDQRLVCRIRFAASDAKLSRRFPTYRADFAKLGGYSHISIQ